MKVRNIPLLKEVIRDTIKGELDEYFTLAKEPPSGSKLKESKELLTRKEVASKFRISLVTLNDWSKKGILKSYRIGNRVLYKSYEIGSSLKPINKV